MTPTRERIYQATVDLLLDKGELKDIETVEALADGFVLAQMLGPETGKVVFIQTFKIGLFLLRLTDVEIETILDDAGYRVV